jgi:hypothetical protein
MCFILDGLLVRLRAKAEREEVGVTWTRPPIGCHGPTTNSPEPKKSSQKTGRKEEEKKSHFRNGQSTWWSRRHYVTRRGITTDYRATHAGEGHHSKDNSPLPYGRPRWAFTHQLAGTVWIVVIVVVTISIPQSSPQDKKKKGKHHLYMYISPLFLNDTSAGHRGRTCHEPDYIFQLAIWFPTFIHFFF